MITQLASIVWALSSIVAPSPQPPLPIQDASAAAATSALAAQRARVDEANAARKAGDYDKARTISSEVVADLFAMPQAQQDAKWREVVNRAGHAAWDAEDVATANSAFKRVYEQRTAALPEDDPDLQAVRENFALTRRTLGDLTGARELQEKVLEIYSRTLTEDDRQLQAARLNLASTLRDLGELARARELESAVLEAFSRTLPDDHPDLQAVRENFSLTLSALGDLKRALELGEKVLEVRSKALPDDDPDLQRARLNVAASCSDLGDLARARELDEKVLEVYSRTLPNDHPNLLVLRGNLAVTLKRLGDLAGARALEEKVLEIVSRTLPDDHPSLQFARENLAVTLEILGDPVGARALFEKVLEVRSSTLPDDNLDLQRTRQNLAAAMKALGDFAGARELEEKVLQIRSETLPDDHPDLQAVRGNLAVTMKELGDLAGARELDEKVLEVFESTLHADHPDLQFARENLAVAIKELGEIDRARELEEAVLEVRSRTLPDDHPDMQRARHNLAETMAVLAARNARASGQGKARAESEQDKARCTELLLALCRGQLRAVRTVLLASPGREAEERCARLASTVDIELSFARGAGVLDGMAELEPVAFELSETARGARLVTARLARTAGSSSKYAALRSSLAQASDELAQLAQRGTTSEAFDAARVKREAAERELIALAHELAGDQLGGAELDVGSLAKSLGEGRAAVAFRRFRDFRLELGEGEHPAVHEVSNVRLVAFVVRSDATLTLVDLGEIKPIAESVRAWRSSLGFANDGRGVAPGGGAGKRNDDVGGAIALRERVFDPLRSVLGDLRQVVLVPDDVLHLIAFDALPLDAEGNELLGNRYRIEIRESLTELLNPTLPAQDGQGLVCIGDVHYDQDETSRVAERPTTLRGGAWSSGFTPLPGTRGEILGLEQSFVDAFGPQSKRIVLTGSDPTKQRLIELAPKARFVHIATHGWFASESVPSWSDPEPLDRRNGLAARRSSTEQIQGTSPMLLCGLALAGANLPEDAAGRPPGLITAEQLSALDLSSCELAVLSACDTNLGEQRAGQGIASLQMALQMAGARSVITSLWKVPDEATKELMLDFYRRLWIEGKPKWRALWEAKTKLRTAKDEHGAPMYTTRDWAAWVLTGEPD